jgi:superfamily II DNA/RNA helicase
VDSGGVGPNPTLAQCRQPMVALHSLLLMLAGAALARAFCLQARTFVTSSASLNRRNDLSRAVQSALKVGRGPSYGRSKFDSGSRNRTPVDPFAKLNFKKTLKIDTSIQSPVEDMQFSPLTLAALTEKGFKELTPVQSQSYEYVFRGDDVVARSRTGTGKTFAFGLPLIEKVVAEGSSNQRGQPLVLILEPTRELAVQVAQELSSVCRKHRMRVEAIYGGVSFMAQERALRDNVDFLVATPGRLLDHISRGTVNLSKVRHVVLDEGDTMLEMGFQQDVESILMSVKTPGEAAQKAAKKSLQDKEDFYSDDDDDFLGKDKLESLSSASQRDVQMLLFSATMPAWICKLTDKLMRSPVFLDAVQEGETRLAATITHYSIPLPRLQDRRLAVKSYVEDLILTKGAGGQTIVFTNTKEEADDLLGSGCFGLLKSQVLHGDIGQSSRQATIRAFKEGKLDVLVATDVAARGLDIAGVDLVVHTAPPQDSDSYVHRSGRTGRAGRSGTAVMLYSGPEERKLRMLQSELNFKFIHSSAPTPQQVMEASTVHALKRLERVDDEVVDGFRPFAQDLLVRAENNDLFQEPPIVIGEDEEENHVEVEEKSAAITAGLDREKATELVARCLAVISNRLTISTRYVQWIQYYTCLIIIILSLLLYSLDPC